MAQIIKKVETVTYMKVNSGKNGNRKGNSRMKANNFRPTTTPYPQVLKIISNELLGFKTPMNTIINSIQNAINQANRSNNSSRPIYSKIGDYDEGFLETTMSYGPQDHSLSILESNGDNDERYFRNSFRVSFDNLGNDWKFIKVGITRSLVSPIGNEYLIEYQGEDVLSFLNRLVGDLKRM